MLSNATSDTVLSPRVLSNVLAICCRMKGSALTTLPSPALMFITEERKMVLPEPVGPATTTFMDGRER